MALLSRSLVTGLVAIACSAALFAAGATSAAPQPPSPMSGHAQVIAQRVVALPAGAHHWSTGGGVLDPGTEVTPAARTGFVLATGGTLVAVDGSGAPTARLGIDRKSVV